MKSGSQESMKCFRTSRAMSWDDVKSLIVIKFDQLFVCPNRQFIKRAVTIFRIWMSKIRRCCSQMLLTKGIRPFPVRASLLVDFAKAESWLLQSRWLRGPARNLSWSCKQITERKSDKWSIYTYGSSKQDPSCSNLLTNLIKTFSCRRPSDFECSFERQDKRSRDGKCLQFLPFTDTNNHAGALAWSSTNFGVQDQGCELWRQTGACQEPWNKYAAPQSGHHMTSQILWKPCKTSIDEDCWPIGEAIMLIPEPENEHDPHAIAVRKLNGQKLGYVPREMNQLHDFRHGILFGHVKSSGQVAGREPALHGAKVQTFQSCFWLLVLPASIIGNSSSFSYYEEHRHNCFT